MNNELIEFIEGKIKDEYGIYVSYDLIEKVLELEIEFNKIINS
jgi:hypothetical protein